MADPLFNLSSLNGKNGFAINGSASDSSGNSVSNAGDINHDGIDDLIIGAPGAGKSYVVFGSTNAFSTNDELSKLCCYTCYFSGWLFLLIYHLAAMTAGVILTSCWCDWG
ncbi:MAG: FG-GAP repeat protein [Nostoc sp. NMS1]|uniref:integrin alpha n=1 Tax=unclassified Nostoc TaxID=2593658 RepID=UPI0025EBA34C|nr:MULTISPECIES: integrin alpha [unclassified Nostoc]MBN3907555.1 FG-GAP repeat protein [Nostoc sp. NMS1]MBN3994489.1 FG-GAP repeat protein [Nostoc sp. NMS2]